MNRIIKLIRVKHWIKNGLIVLPLIFNRSFFQWTYFYKTMLAFLAFSFTASMVYIINDIRDAEKDRCHPVKQLRPIASGEVSIPCAIALVIVLGGMAAIIDRILLRGEMISTLYLIIYFIINVFYSMGLKDVPIVDIVILMSGFLLRLLYGSEAIGIQTSDWLFLTVVSLSFYLGLGKRRNELKKQGTLSRKVLKFYSHEFLDKYMYLCLALALTFYSLWAVSAENLIKMNGGNLLWSVPFIMVICMRYSMDVESESFGDPVDVVFGDKMLLLMSAAYLIGMFVTIYAPILISGNANK